MNFKDKMGVLSYYVIAMRREFHRIPELSFAEHETTKRIGEKLQELNIPFEINPEKTRVLSVLLRVINPVRQ